MGASRELLHDVAIAFRDATESVGFKLDMEGGNSHKYIKCINTTLGQYHRFGVEIYTEGLSIIMDAWHGIHSSLNGEIIKAVMYFVYTYHNIYKRSRLVQALSNAVPGEIYKAIKSDFDLTGDRKGIFQIWLLYNSMDRRGRLAVIF